MLATQKLKDLACLKSLREVMLELLPFHLRALSQAINHSLLALEKAQL